MKTTLTLIVIGIYIFKIAEGLSRIIGGQPAENGAHPYQVSLRTANDVHFCGGSIITFKTVLTSARCVLGRTPKNTFVYAGSNKLHGQGAKYGIGEILAHNRFNSTTIENDVALVILADGIKLSSRSQPIGIGYNRVGGGVNVTFTGWGEISYPEGLIPEDLQVANLTTLTPHDCLERLGESERIFESNLCTISNGMERVCFSDSGSPLVIDRQQVGILSWGYSCATDHPAIYSRISSFTEWIDSNKV